MTPSCAERVWISGLVGALWLAWVGLLWPPSVARAHVPVPASVLDPRSAPEAWNVLRLATANIGRLVGEDRLNEVPDQASLCSPALRTLARLADGTPRQQETVAAAVRASSSVASLAQACVAGDRAGVDAALRKLRAALDALAVGTDPQTLNADVFFCPMHPDATSLDGRALCPKCGMALTPRRIPYSFVYVAPPGEPSMRMTAACDAPLRAGQPAHVTVRLTKRDGAPVNADDLLVAHTQKIHLLIVDSAREDYHHEHPVSTGRPGEYEFTFTPANSKPHRIYADVVPAATGIQEYLPADLPGVPEHFSLPQATESPRVALSAEAEGLEFQIATESSGQPTLRAGQTCALQILICRASGAPFAGLEPVMSAFAHLVGFYDDNRTVVHLHPAGPEIADAALRGGPDLRFMFYPPRSGFLRLYCQVQVDGQTIFVPFGVNVAP